MHELGIANSILDAVRCELQRHPDARATAVGVRIGELAAIDEDALRFGFETLVRDTELEGLRLAIEWCPRRHRCRNCQCEFKVREYDFQCPQCRAVATGCVSGNELELAYLEVEGHESSPAGTKSSQ
jgi:hydrogenase nickel incorporation protein HypA/HybF